MNIDHYYSQPLEKVWSSPTYVKYEKAPWEWWYFPFADELCANKFILSPPKNDLKQKKILEVGSAMGRAYEFLKRSGKIDLTNYTGIEVSEMGHERSRLNFPEAGWIQADFTRYELTDMYDYVFERHAIHHMPNPLVQYKKLLQHTKAAMQTLFRGRLVGETVSDLDHGRFVSKDGMYYLNLINVYDLVRMGLSEGFNHVHVLYCGEHEPIGSDPKGDVFLSREVQESGGPIMRFAVRIARCTESHPPRLTASARYLKHKLLPFVFNLKARLSQLVS